ncbi:MAG: hypothetical protein AAF799_32525 [Myxococcota bacterium]
MKLTALVLGLASTTAGGVWAMRGPATPTSTLDAPVRRPMITRSTPIESARAEHDERPASIADVAQR